jgi:hypothetical protein
MTLSLFKYLQQTTEWTVKVTKYRNGLKSNAKIVYTKNNWAQRVEMHMNKTTQKNRSPYGPWPAVFWYLRTKGPQISENWPRIIRATVPLLHCTCSTRRKSCAAAPWFYTLNWKGSTHRFIRKVLAWPFLPAEQITETFNTLKDTVDTEKITKLMDYIIKL